MINSRSVDDLNPKTRQMALNMLLACQNQGITLLITSTFRDAAAQDALYAQGRTKPGKVVTKAKAGFSWHNFRCAFDICPKDKFGKLIWEDRALYAKIGQIGKSCGLEWGGDWVSFKDYPHFQFTAGLTLADLRVKYGKEAPASK